MNKREKLRRRRNDIKARRVKKQENLEEWRFLREKIYKNMKCIVKARKKEQPTDERRILRGTLRKEDEADNGATGSSWKGVSLNDTYVLPERGRRRGSRRRRVHKGARRTGMRNERCVTCSDRPINRVSLLGWPMALFTHRSHWQDNRFWFAHDIARVRFSTVYAAAFS